MCVCVVRREVETFCTSKMFCLISEVSRLLDTLYEHAAVNNPFRKERKKKCRTNYSGFLFTGEAWMRFLSVKDVLVSAQVRCSRWWDEDILWNHALKKRKKLLDGVIMDGYCSFSYEQQFFIMQILKQQLVEAMMVRIFFISYDLLGPRTEIIFLFNAEHISYYKYCNHIWCQNTHCTCSTNLTG